MQTKKNILAGPWVGEFGWELFCWQAYLRKLSLEGNNVVVISRLTSEFLYRDFYHQHVPFEPVGKNVDAYLCKDMQNDFVVSEKNSFDQRLDPRNKLVFYTGHSDKLCVNFFDQNFLKYGKSNCAGYDVIIHARQLNRCADRNWNTNSWQKFVDMMRNDNLTVASVGANNMAGHINGSVNLIGIGLEELADVMANSGVMVGPSSGPVHYASLCGLPHVVWSPPKNRKKYLDHWNPFKTKVSFYDRQGWSPEVENIYKLVKEMII